MPFDHVVTKAMVSWQPVVECASRAASIVIREMWENVETHLDYDSQVRGANLMTIIAKDHILHFNPKISRGEG